MTADGKRVTVSADQEIVLKCGDASITLTAAGKVLIRGAYLLSRSSGANRIKAAWCKSTDAGGTAEPVTTRVNRQ